MIICPALLNRIQMLSYPSDLRDTEWALIAPLIPPAKRGGRRREVYGRCRLADRGGQAFRVSRSSQGALVVERTIAWINRCRRLAEDYENLNRTAVAFIRLASIRLMLRRIIRYCYPS